MSHLPTDRVHRLHGRALPDEGAPLVLVSKAEGTQRIMAADRLAEQKGLTPGMALAQARAMVPELCVLPYDADADRHLLEAIADWADRYTPLVGRDPPHGLLLDITGAAHLLGGEVALKVDVIQRLERQGIHAVAAIAPTVGAAWALSHCQGGGMVPETAAVGDLDAVLARLPVSGLRLTPETAAALGRVGLKRIGDLIGRPRSALAARFGVTLIIRLDQARGIDTEAISPRQPMAPAIVEHGFAEPVLTTAAIEAACRSLAAQLVTKLEERGQGATALQLSVYRVDGLVRRIDLKLACPCKVPKTLADLMTLRLGHLDDPLDPGFGYDLVRLAATAIGDATDEERRFDDLGDDASPAELAVARASLVDRLGARFGEANIRTIAFADTHIPERATGLILARRVTPAVGAPTRGAKTAATVSKPGSKPGIGLPQRMRRPLRLFDPAEPVEVMAEVPDGPPILLQWRRRRLRLVRAEGPERIAMEWWRPEALAANQAERAKDKTRDYWRVEDTAGRRLWLYREGFYEAQPGGTACWFVHGLFA